MNDRNQTAHSNGHIFFSTKAALDIKITEILRVVEEIQTHSKPVIEHCYREFLIRSQDYEKREYPDAIDQIRGVLIHENYMSQMDIKLCLAHDLSDLRERGEVSQIEELHNCLQAAYGMDIERA